MRSGTSNRTNPPGVKDEEKEHTSGVVATPLPTPDDSSKAIDKVVAFYSSMYVATQKSRIPKKTLADDKTWDEFYDTTKSQNRRLRSLERKLLTYLDPWLAAAVSGARQLFLTAGVDLINFLLVEFAMDGEIGPMFRVLVLKLMREAAFPATVGLSRMQLQNLMENEQEVFTTLLGLTEVKRQGGDRFAYICTTYKPWLILQNVGEERTAAQVVSRLQQRTSTTTIIEIIEDHDDSS